MPAPNVVVVYREVAPRVIRVATPGPPGLPGMRWRGAWSEHADYLPMDVVRLNDDLWIAVRPNRGERPGASDSWQLFLSPEAVIERIDGGEL